LRFAMGYFVSSPRDARATLTKVSILSSTLAEAYASEVCPISLRGYLLTFVNLCWVMGHLIGAGILRKAAIMTGTWSYRMPFAVQWAWPVPLFALLLFAPESPWWLVRKGKLDKAERSVRRLAPSQQKDEARDAVAAMVRTNQLEKDVQESTSWLSCFRGTDLSVCLSSRRNIC